jgi:tetratricopeptide (TPR) repeat protein
LRQQRQAAFKVERELHVDIARERRFAGDIFLGLLWRARYIGHAYAREGQTDEAERVLEELKGLSKRQYISPYSIALVYIGLEQKDEAFKWLEKTYEDQNDMLVWLKIAPEVDSLRSDPRFADLLSRVGFQPRLE